MTLAFVCYENVNRVLRSDAKSAVTVGKGRFSLFTWCSHCGDRLCRKKLEEVKRLKIEEAFSAPKGPGTQGCALHKPKGDMRTQRPLSSFRSAATLAAVLLAGIFGAAGVAAQTRADALANNTVLIVRHAEKPKLGVGLTEEGRKRAELYVRYFEPFHEPGFDLRPTALYSGADSKDSNRPRLTLEPLAAATGMKLHSTFNTKQPEDIVAALRAEPHGKVPLICWRHGGIPGLIDALGGKAADVIPGGKWPDETYDWIVVMKFDAAGKLESEKLVKETLAQ